MNLNELEQQMKESFAEKEFSPKDQEWERLQEALRPKHSSRLLLLLPFHKAVAAAALIVGLGTTGLYLFLSRPSQDGISLSTTPAKTIPAIARMPQRLHKPETEEQAPYPAFSGQAHQVVPARNTTQQETILSGKEPDKAAALLTVKEESAIQTQEQPLVPGNHENNRKQPGLNTNGNNNYYRYAAAPESNVLRLGLAANIGKPSLGDMQYNVGVVARKNLSKRLFAEANVSVSSSNVRYSEPGHLPSRGTNQTPGDGLGTIATPVDLNFTNNIISVGVSPVVGYKIASNFSLSAGGDIYRALNRDLKPRFTAQEYNGSLNSEYTKNDPLPERSITNWDFGLKAQLEYKLNRNFSLSTQYRQGLTQYILIDGKSLKNSNLTMGLKYYFIKVK
jgi:hypothetical protein